MCLEIKKDSQELTAETDLVCYKLVRVVEGNTKLVEYKTLFYGARISIGSSYESELYRDSSVGFDEIEEGLHSFKTLHAAKALRNSYSNTKHSIRVVKCTIPKGSQYYIGVFDNCIGYASTALRYDRIVKIKEDEGIS